MPDMCSAKADPNAEVNASFIRAARGTGMIFEALLQIHTCSKAAMRRDGRFSTRVNVEEKERRGASCHGIYLNSLADLSKMAGKRQPILLP